MLELQRHSDGILELRMARPPVNALNGELLGRLREAIEAAPGDGAQGLVLSGRPGLFSAGLDVPSLLALDRAGLERDWKAFIGVCEALAACPIPVVAAITGHSPAGGAVLSLYCDYRVMAEGAFRIGLNEVQVGLVVPEPIQFALRRLVGDRRAERLLVAGAMIEAEEAQHVGMVDERVPVEQVVARSLAWLQGTLALPRRAMLGTRALVRAELAAALRDPQRMQLEAFIEHWFATDTQAVLKALVARLKSKG